MLLTYESKVELDYVSLINMGIHVPEIGSAILINDEENAEKMLRKWQRNYWIVVISTITKN